MHLLNLRKHSSSRILTTASGRGIHFSTKHLNVWCLEKVQGIGSIMHPTNKLDVRPISLFEVSYKLIETILAKRINDVMEAKLHPAQHAFGSLCSVIDAVIAYTFIMEDAKQ